MGKQVFRTHSNKASFAIISPFTFIQDEPQPFHRIANIPNKESKIQWRKSSSISLNLAVSGSLADLLKNSLVGNLAEVGALDFGVDTGQGTAKSVFG